MEEFIIREINNGWLLQGPNTTAKGETIGSFGRELFLPTILAVADILQTWHHQGYTKAAIQAKDKYEWRK